MNSLEKNIVFTLYLQIQFTFFKKIRFSNTLSANTN